ncbi:uncharacterized protein PAF06_001089 [Gastrophryne carolinensis]
MTCSLRSSIPALGKEEEYHVFISYSSSDSVWVSGLIHKLEESLPDLKICFHERDFVPGKTIIDNMVTCIQSSQKIVIVLSPDFVRSQWCLFEANLSIFQNSLPHKTIVPVMLKPCLVPLYLSHLTCLEFDDDHFFDKLWQGLLGNNDQAGPSTLIHYQPSFLYNGKTLQNLLAINENEESWKPGLFSSAPVPDSLKAVLEDPGTYKDAVEIINDIPISKSCLRFTACRVVASVLLGVLIPFHILFTYSCIMASTHDNPHAFVEPFLPIAMVGVLLIPTLLVKILSWKSRESTLVTKKMVKKTGQANVIFGMNSLLAGCASRAKLYFVYVPLHQCMQTIYTAFGNDRALASRMWKKAIITYSSDYACCLARNYFPNDCQNSSGHWQDRICFCQYVSTYLKK